MKFYVQQAAPAGNYVDTLGSDDLTFAGKFAEGVTNRTGKYSQVVQRTDKVIITYGEPALAPAVGVHKAVQDIGLDVVQAFVRGFIQGIEGTGARIDDTWTHFAIGAYTFDINVFDATLYGGGEGVPEAAHYFVKASAYLVENGRTDTSDYAEVQYD